MKQHHKSLMFLLSLIIMGGVGTPIPVNASVAEASDDASVTVQVVSQPKAYYITNKESGFYLYVGDSGVTVENVESVGAGNKPTVFLTPVTKSDGSGGYVISSSNENAKYLCLGTSNDGTLSTTSDINNAYILDMHLTKGVYSFSDTDGKNYLGESATSTGSSVLANKATPTFDTNNNVSGNSNAAWTLSKAQSPRLLPAMYFKWDGWDANAVVEESDAYCDNNWGKDVNTVFGNGYILPTHYADLTPYKYLVLVVESGTPRIFFNTKEDEEPKGYITVSNSNDYNGYSYLTIDGKTWTIDLEAITKDHGFAHLNAIKALSPDAGVTTNISSATLELYEDKTELDLTINVWRKAGLGNTAADEGNSQSVDVDFTDVCSFLDVNAVTIDMLKMVNKDGSLVDIKMNDDETAETVSDGWFDINGNPNKGWYETQDGNPGALICAKLFQAVTSQTNSVGTFKIYNYPGTGNNGDVYSAKWAITANDKTVIYTIYVHFITFAGEKVEKVADNIGGSFTESSANLWLDRGNNDVKVYMGGWKYQSGSKLADAYPNTSGSYSLHTLENGKVKTQTDAWKKSGKEKSPNEIVDIQQATIDGYLYGSFGVDNARSEFLWENGVNPPFEYALKKRGKINGKGNPFTLPCFGAFLKIEPTQNGKMVVYVVQNGVLDMSTSKSAGTEIYGLTNNISWRPVYIVDEAGNCLPENTNEDGKQPNGVTAETNQRIYVGMDHSQSVSGQPFAYWVNQYFETGKGKNHQNLKDYWKASGEKQEMMPPSKTGDGWISVSKAYVKYTFDVKAGKSYYIFSNDTKIAYCGYEFIPTNEPTDEITIYDNGDYASEAEWKSQVDGFAGKSYKSVTITRTFHQGWNAICLPFSVTEDKMRDLFGTDGKETYELVIYNGAEPIQGGSYLKAHFFRHAYQDIIAWYPYMIYIPEGAKVLEKGFTVENVTFDAYEDINVSSSVEYMPSGSGFEDISTETDYTFKGHHYKHEVPAASYLVTPQGIQYYKNAQTMNAFRSYLAPNEQRDPSEIKIVAASNFSNVLDDEHWNDATVIKALAEEMGLFSQPSDVYSVSGLLVRQNATSLVGLPKGIYIVNGKKYFVK